MGEKRMAGHPHHKGKGMAEFNRDHHESKHDMIGAGNFQYCGENGGEELYRQAKKLNSYAESHKMKY